MLLFLLFLQRLNELTKRIARLSEICWDYINGNTLIIFDMSRGYVDYEDIKQDRICKKPRWIYFQLTLNAQPRKNNDCIDSFLLEERNNV